MPVMESIMQPALEEIKATLRNPKLRLLKNALKRVYLYSYFGLSRECQVCNSHLRTFQPLPQFYSDNIKKHEHDHEFSEMETLNVKEYSCPKCQCSDRDRLYWLYMKSKLSFNKIRILDFAPAKSLSDKLRSLSGVSYRSCDLYMSDVDDKMDIQNLKYADNSFDFFICSHVLEHIPDDIKAMSELYRIVKPGGSGICMVPISLKLQADRENTYGPNLTDEQRWKYFGQNDHIRVYSKPGFKQKLQSVGFKVREYSPKELTQNKSPEYYGIGEGSVLYVVEK